MFFRKDPFNIGGIFAELLKKPLGYEYFSSKSDARCLGTHPAYT